MVAKHGDGGGIGYRQVDVRLAIDTCLVDQQKKVEDNERMEVTEKVMVVAAPANGRNEQKKIWRKVKFSKIGSKTRVYEKTTDIER